MRSHKDRDAGLCAAIEESYMLDEAIMDGIGKLVPGMQFFPDFISEEAEARLLEQIHAGEWDIDTGKRRVQIFGFNYLHPDWNSSLEVTMPSYLRAVAQRIRASTSCSVELTEAIIQEYTPGQGLKPHVDRVIWGDYIAGLSLQGDIVMSFQPIADATGRTPYHLHVNRRSLYVLTGESRYDWTHGIPARTHDLDVERTTRISITFRFLNTPENRPKRVLRKLPRITANMPS